MRAVTIKEAKAHLNALVEAAVRGEQVVLLRGSKHVAAIVPVTAEEIELPPRLTDAQAERLWRNIADDRASGKMKMFATPRAAAAFIASARPRRNRPGPSRRY